MAGHGMADHAAVPSLEMTVKTGMLQAIAQKQLRRSIFALRQRTSAAGKPESRKKTSSWRTDWDHSTPSIQARQRWLDEHHNIRNNILYPPEVL